MPESPQPTSPEPPAATGLSRRTAVALLAVVLVTSLVLRLWNSDAGLPFVFHSDYRQVVQSGRLLTDGTFEHRVPYHPGNTFVHAAGAAITWTVNAALGSGEAWDDFLQRFRIPTVHHTIGRRTTSVLGSLIAIAVYLLARVRFKRNVALLAAAIVAFAPMQIIFSHQARIHVPAIMVLSFAAVAAVKMGAGQAKWRTATAAGVGAALTVTMVQYGFLLLGTAGLLTLFLARPFGNAVKLFLVGAVSFLAAHVATLLLMYGTGLATQPGGQGMFTDFWTLGMSESSVSLRPEVAVRLVKTWVLSEPVRTLAVLLFVLGCLRKRLPGRDLLIYGLYPVIAFGVIGAGIGGQPRYAMSNTPFLAVLAAAGALSIRHALIRRTLVLLLLAVPLATSIRYDAMILETLDTRVAIHRILGRLATPEMPVAINYELALTPRKMPADVEVVPPRGDYSVMRLGSDWGVQLLADSPAKVFIRPIGHWAGPGSTNRKLRAIGFTRYGVVRGGVIGSDFLPDAPQHPSIAIWTVPRTGPSIELWVRTDEARAALQEILPPAKLFALGMN